MAGCLSVDNLPSKKKDRVLSVYEAALVCGIDNVGEELNRSCDEGLLEALKDETDALADPCSDLATLISELASSEAFEGGKDRTVLTNMLSLCDRLQRSLSVKSTVIEKNSETISLLQQEVSEGGSGVIALQNKIEELTTDHEEQLRKLKKRHGLERECLEDKAGTLETQLSGLGVEFEKHKSTLQKNSRQDAFMADTSRKNAALERQVDELRGELSGSQQTIAGLKGQITRLESDAKRKERKKEPSSPPPPVPLPPPVIEEPKKSEKPSLLKKIAREAIKGKRNAVHRESVLARKKTSTNPTTRDASTETTQQNVIKKENGITQQNMNTPLPNVPEASHHHEEERPGPTVKPTSQSTATMTDSNDKIFLTETFTTTSFKRARSPTVVLPAIGTHDTQGKDNEIDRLNKLLRETENSYNLARTDARKLQQDILRDVQMTAVVAAARLQTKGLLREYYSRLHLLAKKQSTQNSTQNRTAHDKATMTQAVLETLVARTRTSLKPSGLSQPLPLVEVSSAMASPLKHHVDATKEPEAVLFSTFLMTGFLGMQHPPKQPSSTASIHKALRAFCKVRSMMFHIASLLILFGRRKEKIKRWTGLGIHAETVTGVYLVFKTTRCELRALGETIRKERRRYGAQFLFSDEILQGYEAKLAVLIATSNKASVCFLKKYFSVFSPRTTSWVMVRSMKKSREKPAILPTVPSAPPVLRVPHPTPHTWNPTEAAVGGLGTTASKVAFAKKTKRRKKILIQVLPVL